MNKWESLVDRLIRESMERGEFKDLAGAGKPIDLSENPFEDPDLRTTYRLLRNAGFAPAWIEELKDIDARQQQAVAVLRRAKKLYRTDTAQWLRAVTEFREVGAELNQRIRLYNLKTPVMKLQRKVIDINAIVNELEQEEGKGVE
jgi:DnaJ family protein C protein 28